MELIKFSIKSTDTLIKALCTNQIKKHFHNGTQPTKPFYKDRDIYDNKAELARPGNLLNKIVKKNKNNDMNVPLL